MRFHKGIHYRHPPRGRARKPYRMSEAARRQRLANLKGTRRRSDCETAIIKLLIWQVCFSGPARSQRIMARELGVRHSYIHKVQEQANSVGVDALANGRRVTLDDLADAQRFTTKLREQEPGLLAPRHAPVELENEQQSAMTADESIAKTWREVREWKRSHPTYRSLRVPVLGSGFSHLRLHGRQSAVSTWQDQIF